MICACCKEYKMAGRGYPMTAAGLCALWGLLRTLSKRLMDCYGIKGKDSDIDNFEKNRKI